MKRVLFMCLTALGLVFYSCNNSAPSSKSVTKDRLEPNYSPELIEWAKHYHLNIDTTKIYDIDIRVFQSLGDYECLAYEYGGYGAYDGKVLYYWSADMVYDEKIIKEKAYLLGTYHYTTKKEIRKVVPFYCNTAVYKNKKDIFQRIIEVQNYTRN